MAKDNSVAAFPRIKNVVSDRRADGKSVDRVEGADGLSKREWFAGQAIGAVIKQCCGDRADVLEGRSVEQYFAEKAFAIADAMLKAGEA